MIRKLIISTLTFLVALTAFGQEDTAFKKADHYKTKKFDVAIFPSNYFALIPGQRFTPTRQEIDRAEISLRYDLKILNKQLLNQSTTPVIHKNLHKYKRQYFGYVDKNGDRILLINNFWSKDNDYKAQWLVNMIIVHDGGSYYWNVKFNLNKKQLFDLEVNGYG